MQNEGVATHARAVEAWEQVKLLDAPKTYEAWKRASDTDSNN